MSNSKYSVIDLVPPRVIDQNSMTITEICKSRGLDRNMAYEIRNQNVQEGLWEKVEKKVGNKLTESYRLTAKGRREVVSRQKEVPVD